MHWPAGPSGRGAALALAAAAGGALLAASYAAGARAEARRARRRVREALVRCETPAQTASAPSSEAALRLRERGLCVLRRALDAATVEALLGVAERVRGEVESGEHVLSMTRNKGRKDVLLPELAAPQFACLHSSAAWLGVAREALGGDCVVVFVGMIYADPHAEGGAWHADGRRLFPGPTEDGTPPHALNVFVPLVDLSAENGAPEFVVGSHVGGERASGGDVAAFDAEAGDALVFDFRLVHRARPNASARPRPMLYVTLAAPWFRDVSNWPGSVRPHFAGLLGDAPEPPLPGGGTGVVKKPPSSEEARRAARRRLALEGASALLSEIGSGTAERFSLDQRAGA